MTNCPNLTETMQTSSTQPSARGGFADIYQGLLGDGFVVAIKLARSNLNRDTDNNTTVVCAHISMPISVFKLPLHIIDRGPRNTCLVQVPAPQHLESSWFCGVA